MRPVCLLEVGPRLSVSVSAELIACCSVAAARIMKTVRHVPIILEGEGRIIHTTTGLTPLNFIYGNREDCLTGLTTNDNPDIKMI